MPGISFANTGVVHASKQYFLPEPEAFAQLIPDTVPSGKPSALQVPPDSLMMKSDTLRLSADSGKSGGKKGFVLEANIDYAAADSISFDIKNHLAYMYGSASILYKDIKLKAGKITIDFDKKILYATCLTDTSGKKQQIPDFTQGNNNFRSENISYNFTNRKGLIKNVVTKEGDGFLHAEAIKKLNDNENAARGGMYTTCDLDHPHYAINFSKAKVITGNKIVTGPAYLQIEGVPLPLALPFGLFPNKKGRNSGIIMPQYGESAKRGFFFENGGYYFGINDYIDLKLLGDIYTRGSWALEPEMTYRKKYKYNGNFRVSYAVNIEGIKGAKDYTKRKDFSVRWTHNQDAKARPNGRFSANVNIVSNKFNDYNPTTINNHLSNNFSSSISYSARVGKFGNLSISANHSQNTSTKIMTISLPNIAFNVEPIYPFKRKVQLGKLRWYEKINIKYEMAGQNQIQTDTIMFNQQMFDKFTAGVQHRIPISIGSIPILKYLRLSPSASYSENWYFRTLHQEYIDMPEYSNEADYIRYDTINGFKASRYFTIGASLNTTLYGMLKFRHGAVKAIRHTFTPNINFNYHPDFGNPKFGYWESVPINDKGDLKYYSVFSNEKMRALYSPPPMGKSEAIVFSIDNKLEMKVRSLKDTITGQTKITLIDAFNIRTSYDLAKDTMQWSDVNLSGSTTLFKKINLRYSSTWSPYALDSNGIKINDYEWNVNHKLLRFNNTGWNFSVGYQFSSKDLNKNKQKNNSQNTPKPQDADSPEMQEVMNNPDNFIDWNNEWSLRVDYSFSYNSNWDQLIYGRDRTIIQTIRLQGDMNVTEKWKVNAQTGFDFESKKFAFTQVSIMRDLHCWEMRFNWIPYGTLKSWNFQINVKSAMLKDLKLTRKKDFRDNL